MKPRLLMLDEVNAGLNAAEIAGALELIREIANLGVTIIVIEHLMRVVLSISQRVTVLHHGQLIAQGPPARGRQRSARGRGLSRVEICGRQSGACADDPGNPDRRHDR